MAKKKKLNSAELFDQTYQAFYPQRWEALKQSLEQPSVHCAWFNEEKFSSEQKNFVPDELVKNIVHFKSTEDSKDFYFLDYASALAVEALDVKPGDHVLDLCAAPGGKSLGMALRLKGQGRLVANDKSPARRERLKKVFDDYLNEDQKKIIEVTGYDGGRWSLFEKDAYDKILLDAPCSSERHYLQKPSKLEQWSPSRSKRLSKIQGTLLGAAFDALKVGGRLIYSTCSLSPLENDGLGEWLEKKRAGRFHWERVDFKLGEPTKFGRIFLPDQAQGIGPLYFMCLYKDA